MAKGLCDAKGFERCINKDGIVSGFVLGEGGMDGGANKPGFLRAFWGKLLRKWGQLRGNVRRINQAPPPPGMASLAWTQLTVGT